jgi:hypothetical protein
MPQRFAYYLTLLTILILSYTLAGCGGADIVVVGHPGGYPGENPGGPAEDPDIIVIDDGATIAEIDAARELSFSSDRAEHLGRIARRPDLGPAAQAYLVDSAHDALSFEDQKVSVLNILIKNPTFCAEAKSRVLDRLDELKFNSNRKSILSALDRRGPVVIFPDEASHDELAL